MFHQKKKKQINNMKHNNILIAKSKKIATKRHYIDAEYSKMLKDVYE